MIDLVNEKLAEIGTLCRKHRVQRLTLFGSAVEGDFDRSVSDLDFLVQFLPLSPSGHKEAFFGLLDDLEELYGQHIDLIEAHTVRNPYVKRRIEGQQETVYDAA